MDNPQTIGGVEQTEFPACMMPDGGDPCRAFQLLQSQIEHQLSVIGELQRALQAMLHCHGKPHRDEWMSDSGYQHAIKIQEQALKGDDPGLDKSASSREMVSPSWGKREWIAQHELAKAEQPWLLQLGLRFISGPICQ